MSKINLSCPKCGCDQFVQPDDPTMESKVTCTGCGQEFLAADLVKSNVVDEAHGLATDLARSTLGNLLK